LIFLFPPHSCSLLPPSLTCTLLPSLLLYFYFLSPPLFSIFSCSVSSLIPSQVRSLAAAFTTRPGLSAPTSAHHLQKMVQFSLTVLSHFLLPLTHFLSYYSDFSLFPLIFSFLLFPCLPSILLLASTLTPLHSPPPPPPPLLLLPPLLFLLILSNLLLKAVRTRVACHQPELPARFPTRRWFCFVLRHRRRRLHYSRQYHKEKLRFISHASQRRL
jgi:hypothetical protein